MSDHDEPELHESPLDPAEDARIRALLAEARHTEPMPAEVVARLDRVLDGLASERAPVAPVIDLARRRRTAAKLLVAAAAVVVAGVGVGQVLPGIGGGSDNGCADQATAADSQNELEAEDGDAGGSGRASESAGRRLPRRPAARPRASATRTSARTCAPCGVSSTVVTSRPSPPCRTATCLVAPVGEGTVLAATYDGAAAALVLRLPAGDTQVVDLYLCGQTAPLRSITLTAP